MSQAAATLILSVDAESPSTYRVQDRLRFERSAIALADLLDRYQAPATWAMAEPGSSPVVEVLRRHSASQDLAILGDASWIGPDVGRKVFARELSRRVAQARVKGLNLSGLAVRGARLTHHWDLVVKHQLSAVREDLPVRHSRRGRPEPMRFGLWRFEPTWSAREQRSGLALASLRRSLNRRATGGNTLHLRIDVAGGVGNDWRDVEVLLEDATRLQQQRRLKLASMGQVTAGMLRPHGAIEPARSILRAVA